MPRKIEDLTGRVYGRLTVLRRVEDSRSRHPQWLCQCSCGNTKVVFGDALRGGYTKSCGCYNREVAARRQYKHGGRADRLYGVWNAMKQRCENKNADAYGDYGARGISVCKEWAEDYSAFRDWALQNGFDPKAKSHECTIDRIDNNKGYGPTNCRFVGMSVQANNTRRTHRIAFNGENKTLSEWALSTGISVQTLRYRLNAGWNIERMLTEPVILGKNQSWNGGTNERNCG